MVSLLQVEQERETRTTERIQNREVVASFFFFLSGETSYSKSWWENPKQNPWIQDLNHLGGKESQWKRKLASMCSLDKPSHRHCFWSQTPRGTKVLFFSEAVVRVRVGREMRQGTEQDRLEELCEGAGRGQRGRQLLQGTDPVPEFSRYLYVGYFRAASHPVM